MGRRRLEDRRHDQELAPQQTRGPEQAASSVQQGHAPGVAAHEAEQSGVAGLRWAAEQPPVGRAVALDELGSRVRAEQVPGEDSRLDLQLPELLEILTIRLHLGRKARFAGPRKSGAVLTDSTDDRPGVRATVRPDIADSAQYAIRNGLVQ